MKRFQIIGGVLISAVFLVLAFRGVDLADAWNALRHANYLWVIPATAAIIVSVALRALRWRDLFYPRRDLRYGSLFGAMNVGYLVNDVLPLRLGEVVRAYLAGQTEGVGTAHALSTVAVERVLDVVVTVAFLAAVLPFVDLPAGFNSGAVLAVTGIAFAALAVMLVFGTRRHHAHTLGRLFTRFLPRSLADRLHEVLDSVLRGFEVLAAPVLMARVLLLSVAVWGFAALGVYLTMFAFHIELSPAAPVFVLALVSLSFVIPASPGYVGVFEYTVKTALSVFAVTDRDATSYALVAHVVTFVPPMLLGVFYLWRTGTSLDRIFALRRSLDRGPLAVEVASDR